MSKDIDAGTGLMDHILLASGVETSTPISSQKSNDLDRNESRKPTNSISASRFLAGQPGHSILKNTYTTPFSESSLTYKGNEIPPNPTEPNSSFYSVANDVSRHAELHTVRAQKVLFSPTKEVVSYGNGNEKDGFHVDVMRLDRATDSNKVEESNSFDSLNHTRSSFWRDLAVDPRVPYVLSLYLQLFFNSVLVSVVLYLLYLCISTIRQDVRHKIEIYTSDAILEISRCSRQYYRNKCSTEDGNVRVPALEETCTVLERCMNRDPQQVGKSKITAEAFADIVNAFLHPISWKSAILFTGLMVGGVFVINVAFGGYRSRLKVHEFTQMTNYTKTKEIEKAKDEQSDRIEYVVASTPPNPSIQSNARVVDESTLPFSSPLSSRSGKSGL